MWYLLRTMIFRRQIAFVLLSFTLVLVGCKDRSYELTKGCQINGVINSYDDKNNGFKITLEDVHDAVIQHVVVSDSYGNFMFNDIAAGEYNINAAKQGYEWVLMIDDGKQNPYSNNIKLEDGQVKDIKIIMKNTSSYTSDFDLELTDSYGNPINGSVSVPKYATTISFRLYNGTGSHKSWSVYDTDKCVVSDDIGAYYEYIFSSFSQTSGTLSPGQSVLLIGNINPDIFSIYSNYPRYVINTLSFYSGYYHKEITLNIDF